MTSISAENLDAERTDDGRRIDIYAPAREFLLAIPESARVAVAYHGDADGSGSAALMVRYLTRTGRTVAAAAAPGKGEDLFGDTFRTRLRAATPDCLIVLDQGSRDRAILPEVPTLVVDHHDAPPGGVPVAVYLSGLRESPVPPASLMVWRLLEPFGIDLSDVAWYMAVGTTGDLGAQAPFPEVAAARKRFGAANIAEVVALVNAAKRSAEHDTATSLRVLLAAELPRQIAKGEIDGCDRLAAYRQEIQAERARCAAVAPRFAGDWALVRFSSPCQMHGIIASSWVNRLPKFIVLCANDGYTPGNFHFSVRTRRPSENLLTRLRAFRDTVGNSELGQGHAEASGGVLPAADFERLLDAIGFTGM